MFYCIKSLLEKSILCKTKPKESLWKSVKYGIILEWFFQNHNTLFKLIEMDFLELPWSDELSVAFSHNNKPMNAAE